jgi:acyl-CoA thioesterase-2
MNPVAELIESLALERIEVNLFRGFTPPGGAARIFGGQVIAQALLAAYATVEERLCHSLHCYFLRMGDPKVPILFEVDRSRDGGSFTTRRVAAIQHGHQIFNFAASFQDADQGLEHQSAMPEAPPPEQVKAPRQVKPEEATTDETADLLKQANRLSAIETRYVRMPRTGDGEREAKSHIWMRARGEIGRDQRTQQVIMAFASDIGLMNTAMVPHSVNWATPGLQTASLDHAMWFHRPSDFSRWHLAAMDSPSAGGGRGLNRGEIYSEDGTLVASMVQEGMMRIRKPKA